MAYNTEPTPPDRSNFRMALGTFMVAFSIYPLIMLINVLPGLFENGDTSQIVAYGVLPAVIVVVFFFGGLRIARQGYYGVEKPKREE